jgi:hypothetical protein
MSLQFTKATKRQAKLRLALFGPSGSGKTFTALRVATGLGGSIAVIDTERGSASKYADRFAFDVLDLEDRSVDGYIEAIKAAQHSGYRVLIIDSLSHAWQELLDEVDRIAGRNGNQWAAWRQGTPKQRDLVEALLGYSGHLLATMRSKTEWTTQTNEKGKTEPVRVGLAPEQGKGIEYEFDMLIELSANHTGEVIKDRTGKFQDRMIDKPGEDLGKELVAWLESAELPAPVEPVVTKPKPIQGDTSDAKLFASWIQDRGNRLAWWTHAEQELGLTHAEVYEALSEDPEHPITSLLQYGGTVAGAEEAVAAFINAHAALAAQEA